jgi:hypothetical protein
VHRGSPTGGRTRWGPLGGNLHHEGGARGATYLGGGAGTRPPSPVRSGPSGGMRGANSRACGSVHARFRWRTTPRSGFGGGGWPRRENPVGVAPSSGSSGGGRPQHADPVDRVPNERSSGAGRTPMRNPASSSDYASMGSAGPIDGLASFFN